jgi:hypothetical protein
METHTIEVTGIPGDLREELLVAVEDLDSEAESIRRNQELMEFLDQRSRETKTYTLAQAREILAREQANDIRE